jgi:hypothetical protein
MIKAIVILISLPVLGFYSFITIGIPLSESHAIKGGEVILLINTIVCIGLYCVYALPLRPSGWGHNYYIVTDTILVGFFCFLLYWSLRGTIISIYAAMILVVSVVGLLSRIWTFRRYRQKIKKGELTEDTWAIF